MKKILEFILKPFIRYQVMILKGEEGEIARTLESIKDAGNFFNRFHIIVKSDPHIRNAVYLNKTTNRGVSTLLNPLTHRPIAQR